MSGLSVKELMSQHRGLSEISDAKEKVKSYQKQRFMTPESRRATHLAALETYKKINYKTETKMAEMGLTPENHDGAHSLIFF